MASEECIDKDVKVEIIRRDPYRNERYREKRDNHRDHRACYQCHHHDNRREYVRSRSREGPEIRVERRRYEEPVRQQDRPRTLQIIVNNPYASSDHRGDSYRHRDDDYDYHRQRRDDYPEQYHERKHFTHVENPGTFSFPSMMNVGNNVYVAGIPRRINEDDLKRVFEKYGTILDIKVIKDPATNNSKGFAYILFDKVDDAQNAIANLDNQRVFNDWSLRVERAKRAVAYQVEQPSSLKVEIRGDDRRRWGKQY